MSHVKLLGIEKRFPQQGKQQGEVRVLEQINLSIDKGEFMVLVGPSGCGKSTLLRLIAGLETVTQGEIYINQRDVTAIPPKDRDIAMVFQNYALYPHLTVYDNIAFGLRRTQEYQTPLVTQVLQGITRNLPHSLRYHSHQEKNIAKRVQETAYLLQIESLLERYPKQLSGGQRQRVALGRAIARNPQVFLMDEPLSNLDAKLRTETRTQIVKLQRQLGVTTIYVTHDQVEAMTMGDRIAVLNQGKIQQIASPLELYDHPANRFVAEFIGSPPMNFLTVQYESPCILIHDNHSLILPQQWLERLKDYHGKNLWLGVRPEQFMIAETDQFDLIVTVDLVEALGNDTYLSVYLVNNPYQSLQIRLSPDQVVSRGDTLKLSIKTDKVHLFDYEKDYAL